MEATDIELQTQQEVARANNRSGAVGSHAKVDLSSPAIQEFLERHLVDEEDVVMQVTRLKSKPQIKKALRVPPTQKILNHFCGQTW
eukprot:150732-Amphidinium_carterae.1